MKEHESRENSLRFDVGSDLIRRRTSIVDSLLQSYDVVGATGSLLEAHLVTRLGLSGGIPNLIGCGISPLEVCELCTRSKNVLVFLTESIATDLGHNLVVTLRERYDKSIRIVYILQDRSLASRIVDFNADAFLLASSFGSGAFTRAITSISFGECYLDLDISRAIKELSVPRLTKRERQVLHLLEQGMSNKQMAENLLISPVTVRDYMQSLMQKLDAANRTLVIVKARSKGLL